MSDSVIRPIPDRIEHLGSDLDGILRATGDGQPPSVATPGEHYATPEALASGLGSKADLVHSHAGLSTTIPDGSLWGGQGSGVPGAVAVGPGLAIAGNQLKTAEDYAKAADLAALMARTTALGDGGRVLLWDPGTGNGEPAGHAPTGQEWESDTHSFYTREPDGFRSNIDNLHPFVANVGAVSVEVEATCFLSGTTVDLVFIPVFVSLDGLSYIRVSVGQFSGNHSVRAIRVVDGVSQTVSTVALSPGNVIPGWMRLKLRAEAVPSEELIHLTFQHPRGTTEFTLDNPDDWSRYAGNTRHGVGVSRKTCRLRDIVIRRV